MKYAYNCECGRRNCKEKLLLEVDVFEEVADAGLLLVAEGHRGGAAAVRQDDGWAAIRETEGS